MIRPPPSRPPVTQILPKPPIHPINPGDTTLNLKDRVTASRLESSLEKQLSSPGGQAEVSTAKETTRRAACEAKSSAPKANRSRRCA